jgi:hypothetical protein
VPGAGTSAVLAKRPWPTSVACFTMRYIRRSGRSTAAGLQRRAGAQAWR